MREVVLGEVRWFYFICTYADDCCSGVELRQIYGCIVGTLGMHDLSLGRYSTYFFLYYVYKVSLLFRVILFYVPRLSE